MKKFLIGSALLGSMVLGAVPAFAQVATTTATSTPATGGHRHCDTPNTPTCAEFVKTLGQGTPAAPVASATADGIRAQLVSLIQQLIALLEAQLASM